MSNRLLLFTTVLTLTLVCLVLFPPARASGPWIGNDDGEFDTSSYPSYVFVQESLSTTMHWDQSPPGNLVSLQYNPDRDTSYWNQFGSQWFQSGIISDPNGCAIFTIQVYSLVSGNLVWSSFYPNTGCITVSGILNGAYNPQWYIQEDANGYLQTINSVYFGLVAYGQLSYTINPPQQWYWIRSNICWCGTAGGSTTFSLNTSTGTSYMGSNTNVVAIGPPTDISTAEDSNMHYGSFQNSGTTLMSQSFAAPKSCSGCGH